MSEPTLEEQVSKLTDAEASRLIAENLEPMPPLPKPNERGLVVPYPHPCRFWVYVPMRAVVDQPHEWIVNVNFVTDPAMTVMLLGILKCQVLWSEWPHSISSGRIGIHGWIVSKGVLYSASNADLGRAVVEAFIIAKGLLR